jgi:hypothetical protein
VHIDTVDLSPQLRSRSLLDLDPLPNGRWLGLAETPNGQELLFDGSAVPVPRRCAFPIARWLGNHAAVLLDARTEGPDVENAWVLDRQSGVLAAFAAGDGIQDVLATSDHIVVTYFDEGVFGSPGPNREGIAVFSTQGELEMSYASDIGNPDIADCYCASWASRNEFVFVPYTEFPFVRFDLDTRRPTLIELPKPLHGASAVTVRGDEAVFWSSYDHPGEILRWTIGSREYTTLGAHAGPLRGLRGGTMVAVRSAGYSLLAPFE